MQTDTTVTLVPPPAGITLRLVTIAETGAVVKAGDVVMTFDPADQQYALEQNQSQLLEAEQEIIKRRAEQDVRTQQVNTDILTARFNVRRAEMDTLTPQNFVGANDYSLCAGADGSSAGWRSSKGWRRRARRWTGRHSLRSSSAGTPHARTRRAPRRSSASSMSKRRLTARSWCARTATARRSFSAA
jgi:hypothetical protein